MKLKNAMEYTKALMIAATMLWGADTALAGHGTSVETPTGLTFEWGNGWHTARWTPKGSADVAYTQYSINGGAWGQSSDAAHCTATRSTSCDPYAVKFTNPPSSVYAFDVRIRAVGADTTHAQTPTSEPSAQWNLRNRRAASNELPTIVEAQGWGGAGRTYHINISRVAADGIAIGGPFRIRDADGDPTRCYLEEVSQHNDQDGIVVSGDGFVAGTQHCQIYLRWPLDDELEGRLISGGRVVAKLKATDGVGILSRDIEIYLQNWPLRGRPRIVGKVTVDETLRAQAIIGQDSQIEGANTVGLLGDEVTPGSGNYYVDVDKVAIAWHRENGTAIGTGPEYTPVDDDVGHRLYMTMELPTLVQGGASGQGSHGTVRSKLTRPVRITESEVDP